MSSSPDALPTELDGLVAYIEVIVGPLLEPGDKLSVNHQLVDGAPMLFILVPERSIRFVIGRGGRVAEALRILVRARATARDFGRVNIQIRTTRPRTP